MFQQVELDLLPFAFLLKFFLQVRHRLVVCLLSQNSVLLLLFDLFFKQADSIAEDLVYHFNDMLLTPFMFVFESTASLGLDATFICILCHLNKLLFYSLMLMFTHFIILLLFPEYLIVKAFFLQFIYLIVPFQAFLDAFIFYNLFLLEVLNLMVVLFDKTLKFIFILFQSFVVFIHCFRHGTLYLTRSFLLAGLLKSVHQLLV